RPRLQRRVQVRREAARRLDEEPRDRVVHLGGLYRGEAEADLGDGGDEGLEKVAEARLTPGRRPGVHINQPVPLLTPGHRPGVSRTIPTIRANMDSREHNLGMMLAERPGLSHELRDGARAVRPPCDGRRAEG